MSHFTHLCPTSLIFVPLHIHVPLPTMSHFTLPCPTSPTKLILCIHVNFTYHVPLHIHVPLHSSMSHIILFSHYTHLCPLHSSISHFTHLCLISPFELFHRKCSLCVSICDCSMSFIMMTFKIAIVSCLSIVTHGRDFTVFKYEALWLALPLYLWQAQ